MLFPPITLIYIHHNVNVFCRVDYLINLTKEKFLTKSSYAILYLKRKEGWNEAWREIMVFLISDFIATLIIMITFFYGVTTVQTIKEVRKTKSKHF